MLPQIIPHFPENIDTFIDLFTGGCNVGVNIKANNIVANDIEPHLIKLLNYLKITLSQELISDIESVIKKYDLSQSSLHGYEYYGSDSNKGVAKYNKPKYHKLREDFNKDTSNSLLFYVCLVYAFNNKISFNQSGEFNAAVNKRDFNNNIRKNLITFVDRLKNINIEFTNNDFRTFEDCDFKQDDFIYCDPPYILTNADYNKYWTSKEEIDLLNLLDYLHSKNIKFALSNVLESKGESNDVLKEWSTKYNIHYLDKNYVNSYYQRKSNDKKDVEVLITNY